MGGVYGIRSNRVVLPTGVQPAVIYVEDGRIREIDVRPSLSEPRSPNLEPRASDLDLWTSDLGDLVIMPGLVDAHVHVNEPGRTEWEGFATATAAAAAGGITTIVDMPLNSIPATTTVRALEEKRLAAQGRVTVDVGFWGGVVPGHAHELDALCNAGVLGFKCFLAPSGVDEFPHVGEHDLREAMPVLARRGVPLLVHAELPSELRAMAPGADNRRHATWLASRPEDAEAAAVRLMVQLAREFGTRVHIVHVASPSAMAVIASARAEGLPLTAETCPHYLTFCAEEIADGSTVHKCAPPIRERAAQDALWRALIDGTLQMIASDHSPCPPDAKPPGDFLSAWGGIASLEVSMAAVWTAGRQHGVTFNQLATWMASAPAALAGLRSRKGELRPGVDADLLVWDPDATFTVDRTRLRQRHPVTPYDGLTLRGVVKATYVRGHLVYRDGALAGDPHGALLERL